MTDETAKNGAPKDAVLAAAYTGTATFMGQSLATAAAMLAFFFAFQGILLTSFPSILKAFGEMPSPHLLLVGKVTLSLLCLLAVAFTWWSFLIVRMFIEYFENFINGALALERQCGISTGGLYGSFHATYYKSRPQVWLRRATNLFFLLLIILWAILIARACV